MTLSTEDAEAIVSTCVELARAAGHEVSLAVVDDRGEALLMRRPQANRTLTLELARAKAYTAAVMERPTRALLAWQQADPVQFSQISQLGPHPLLAGDGGVPVSRDGALLGGLGASGAPGEVDQRICEEALAKLGFDAITDAPAFG